MWIEDSSFNIEYHINTKEVELLLKGKSLLADSTSQYNAWLELSEKSNFDAQYLKNELRVVVNADSFKKYVLMEGTVPQGEVMIDSKQKDVFVMYDLSCKEKNELSTTN